MKVAVSHARTQTPASAADVSQATSDPGLVTNAAEMAALTGRQDAEERQGCLRVTGCEHCPPVYASSAHSQ